MSSNLQGRLQRCTFVLLFVLIVDNVAMGQLRGPYEVGPRAKFPSCLPSPPQVCVSICL